MRSCKPFLGRAWGACPMEQGSRRVRSHGARQGYTWCANGARSGAQGTHGARCGAQMPRRHPKRVHERHNLAEKRRFVTLVYTFYAAGGGCIDLDSRHISPKCGRSGAPHAPHARERAQRCTHHANARERAQRCSPKAATTPPRPSKAVNAGGPASPCSVIRSAQREDIGTRGGGASAGNERPMRP